MRYWWWRLPVFMAVASVPLYWLYQAWVLALGPDPGKVLIDRLGQGGLVLLLITLALTPLQRLSGWSGWAAVRRQLGLWSFVYAVLHVCGYLFFILGLEISRLPDELLERPYILVGALAFAGLSSLAVTSNRWSQRRLGKRWKRLHRLVYPIAMLTLLHMLWVVRSDAERWAAYALIAGVLMALRIPAVSGALGRWRAGKRISIKRIHKC